MKISKKLTFSCFVLCFALQFSGCSYIPGLSDNSSETETAKTDKDKPNQQLQEKQKQVDDLKIKQTEQQKGLALEKQKCEDMTKETKKAGKDPQNQKESPQTFAQCQKANTSENQFNETKSNLEKTEQELATIKNQDNPASKLETDANKSDFSWLLWLIGSIAGLGILVILVWKVYSILSDSFKQERENRLRDVGLVRKDYSGLEKKVFELEKVVNLHNSSIEGFRVAINSLEKRIPGGGQTVQQQTIFTPPVYKPEPQFPTAAEDYLNKNRSNAQTAANDHYIELLVHDKDKGEEFLIVRDKNLSSDLAFAVPNAIRFDTKKDYHTYYQKYYNCENPSGGVVWIISPAIVRYVENGWILEKKGELEVR